MLLKNLVEISYCILSIKINLKVFITLIEIIIYMHKYTQKFGSDNPIGADQDSLGTSRLEWPPQKYGSSCEQTLTKLKI